jgi:predicted short-subunit dehydrogenase-like oxidoreductase (DUF2520 family)
MSRVAVIGPGRAGTLLALALRRAGHRLVAVGGGREAARSGIVEAAPGARSYARPADAAADAELVVLCVPDDALEAVVTDLAVAEAVGEGQHVVHVAGSQGLGPLRRAALAGAGVAACHPAMTIPTGARDPDVLVGTAWAVTTEPPDRHWAHELVTELGGDPHDVPDSARVLYHAGLVVGSNAVGAVVSVARRLLLGARISDPAAFLGPLTEASTANVLAHGAGALTGPVVRGDVGTLRAHLDELEHDLPELAGVYRALAGVVLSQVRPSLDSETASRLDDLLGEHP